MRKITNYFICMLRLQKMQIVCRESTHRNKCLISSPTDRSWDLRETFSRAGFDSDPERDVFDALRENALGNITWVL